MGIREKSEAIQDLKANLRSMRWGVKVLELNKRCGPLDAPTHPERIVQGTGLAVESNCSAVYVRRGGKWLNLSSQQTTARQS